MLLFVLEWMDDPDGEFIIFLLLSLKPYSLWLSLPILLSTYLWTIDFPAEPSIFLFVDFDNDLFTAGLIPFGGRVFMI